MKKLEPDKWDEYDKWNEYDNNRNSSNYSNGNHNNYDNSNNYVPDHYKSNKKTVLFSSRQITSNGFERGFEVVFSDATIDLSRISIPLESRRININIVFSNGKIIISEDIPAVISVKSVFSSVRFPNNSNISFGGYDYVTRSFREGAPHLYIKIDCVFGNAEVFENRL